MRDRSEWQQGETGPRTIKGHTYKSLTEFKRPCATCGKVFSIFVTSKIASGHADSNSFGLKNCEDHRRNKPTADLTEIDALRMANSTMKAELEGLYERVRDLNGRLALYELAPAMEAHLAAENRSDGSEPWSKVIGCEAVQNTTNGALQTKLPWE